MVHWIESETFTLFVELKQIPNVLIVYRRPSERNANPEKVQIDGRNLKHVPLLEGEERIKHLSLSSNEIAKIDNIVSMPHLQHLDLSSNHLVEIGISMAMGTNLSSLRVLNLAKNRITKIKNLELFLNLESLDLSSNRIKEVENLHTLKSLRTLNVSCNLLETLDLPSSLTLLVELNAKRNMLKTVGQLDGLLKLQKLYLSFNNVTKISHLSLP